MEELLLASLYDRTKLQKMLTDHDIHKPHCCGAVIYFQGRLLTIGDQSKAVRLGQKKEVEKPWIFYRRRRNGDRTWSESISGTVLRKNGKP